MIDYISRDYTVENMENYPWDTEHDKNAAIHLVRELVPAADVRPVVHGKWIVDSIASNIFSCSVCGQDAPVEPTGGTEYKSNFCPNCGAYMRPEEAPYES